MPAGRVIIEDLDMLTHTFTLSERGGMGSICMYTRTVLSRMFRVREERPLGEFMIMTWVLVGNVSE
jgi:hypothetical protein